MNIKITFTDGSEDVFEDVNVIQVDTTPEGRYVDLDPDTDEAHTFDADDITDVTVVVR